MWQKAASVCMFGVRPLSVKNRHCWPEAFEYLYSGDIKENIHITNTYLSKYIICILEFETVLSYCYQLTVKSASIDVEQH